MQSHFDHLEALVPDLCSRRILDLGSGRGVFLAVAAARGANITGLELSEKYRIIARELLEREGLSAPIVGGEGERLPFANASFDFVNINEVFEHVEDPIAMLREVRRILAPGGKAYLSIPNRFGAKDQHFHLWGVNWLPRRAADSYISMFGRHKDYRDRSVGRQRLAEMHYATYGAARQLCTSLGFTVVDIREKKIRARVGSALQPFALVAYRCLRTIYFDSFHLLLCAKECVV